MAFLFQDQNQGIRNDVGPRANVRGRRKPFSFIRTVTVGFGIAPNLLTLPLRREEGARGLGLRHPYRRWGFSPRPENIGRPEWTTWLNNMTNAGAAASAFGIGNRHVAMPPEQGMWPRPIAAFTQAAAIGIGLLSTGGAQHETSPPEFPQTRRRSHRCSRFAAAGLCARLPDAADAHRRRLR